MLVVTLSDCPAALRGDLTKWLQEVTTNVYAGQVGTRIREELWNHIKDNIKSGRATMVYSANNEQHMDFRIHNSNWEPIDFDGLKLMLRPSPARVEEASTLKAGFSNAAKRHMAKHMAEIKRSSTQLPESYAIIDVETTGLSSVENEIIEIGAVKVLNSQIDTEFHALVKAGIPIPPAIEKLTGLTDDILVHEGRELSQVIKEFLVFVGDLPVVSHNVEFDLDFLRSACERLSFPLFSNRCIDTLALSRRLISDVKNFKLTTLLEYFGIKPDGTHRASNDCLSTKELYDKLIEIRQAQV
jgi:CRISPR-associated protein Cas2